MQLKKINFYPLLQSKNKAILFAVVGEPDSSPSVCVFIHAEQWLILIDYQDVRLEALLCRGSVLIHLVKPRHASVLSGCHLKVGDL